MSIALKDKELSINQILKDLFERKWKKKNGFSHSISEKAFKNFFKIGFPDRKSEDYKYFPVHKFFPESPVIPDGMSRSGSHLLISSKLSDQQAIQLVFIDGILSQEHSNYEDRKEDLEIKFLNQISERDIEKLLDDHTESHNVNKDPFIELNSSFIRDGIYLKIKKKIHPPPIYCYYLTSSEEKKSFRNFRTIMEFQEDSRATLTEFFFSEDNTDGFENYFTEIFAERGAKLDFNRIQHKRGKEVLVNNVNIYQKESSLVNTFTYTLSARMLRNNLNIMLEEENCESHLYGLYLINGDNVIDNHTTVDHQKPHCFSNENYKGIIDENGKGIFNGKIYVRPDAQKTNAFQSNKNIVLTDTAVINTKPQLEIWADDVKCSHGATTGQIDAEQLFYLRTRGLDERTARALLLHAFAFEIVDKIELKTVKEYLTKVINKQLGYQFDN